MNRGTSAVLNVNGVATATEGVDVDAAFASLSASVILEAATEAVLDPDGDGDLGVQLAAAHLLMADIARRLERERPFSVPEVAPTTRAGDVAAAQSGSGDVGASPAGAGGVSASGARGSSGPAADAGAGSDIEEPDELALRLYRYEAQQRTWERIVAETHGLAQQALAARTRATARYSAFDTSAGLLSARKTGVIPAEHPVGHVNPDAADAIAPLLGWGTYRAASSSEESAWIVTKVPRMLADVAAGRANLDTVAAIARELQFASPHTCTQVEDALLTRGIHRRPRSQAARSARSLVATHEARAARRTQRKELGRQIGVWLDPHPMPGLSQLTAVMWSTDAAALMTAIEARANGTHRESQGRAKTGNVPRAVMVP